MRKLNSSLLALSLCTALLSACGGSDEGAIVEEKDPEPSGRAATLTVASATNAALNGVYSTTNINTNNVTKVNPIGGDPETCRFKFDGPTQAGSTRVMGGDIRYIPGTNNLQVAFIAIEGAEFTIDGSAGAQVDRANNEIDFSGAVLRQGTNSITLSGSVPMRPDRPEGC